jgi:hypothetical protein
MNRLKKRRFSWIANRFRGGILAWEHWSGIVSRSMMKRKNGSKRISIQAMMTLVFFATCFSLLFIASLDARSGGVGIPAGNSVLSGSPCSTGGCHDDIAGGSVSFTGLPSAFEPGVEYDIGIEILGGSVYGLQVAVVFSDDSQAGTLTSMTSGVVNDDINGTGILRHNTPLNSGTVNFRWTAPTTPQETSVIFKVAANSANGNFSTSGDRINTDQATVPQQTPPELTNKLFFAQFGNGPGLVSDIVLTNPSAANSISGRVDFLDDNGLPFLAGIVGIGETSSVDFSVFPLGSATISTDGQGAITVVGSAVISSEGTLGGVIRFNISGVGIAGVGASQPLSGFVVPVRREAGGINTGIAIHNTEVTAVTLDLTLRDLQGLPVSGGTATIADLPANGHLAQFIGGEGGLFPGANTDDFLGTLVVEVTGGNVATAALELGTVVGEFTTLPVTPLE